MRKKLIKKYNKIGIKIKTGKHVFKKVDDCWMIKCIDTGGEFSTNIWKHGFEQNVCPCCEMYVVGRKR